MVQRYNPHLTEFLPAFKRTSKLSVPTPGAPLNHVGGQFIPRVVAYEPPAAPPPPELPVLLYREFTRYPAPEPGQAEVIDRLLAAQRDEAEQVGVLFSGDFAKCK